MKKLIKMTAIMLVLVVAASVLVGCSAEKKLAGTWIHSREVLGVVTEDKVVFKDDNTGTISTVGGVDLSMTYETDGDKLSITTSVLGISNTDEYTYKVSGDTLTLTRNGEDTVYTKQK